MIRHHLSKADIDHAMDLKPTSDCSEPKVAMDNATQLVAHGPFREFDQRNTSLAINHVQQ